MSLMEKSQRKTTVRPEKKDSLWIHRDRLCECVCVRQREKEESTFPSNKSQVWFLYLPLYSFEAQLYCKFEIRKILP